MPSTAKNVKSGSCRKPLAVIFIPLAILVSSLILACQPDLRLAVPLMVGMTAVMAATAAAAFYLGERGITLWSPGVILAVALLTRLLFVAVPPQLSDDIYRYLWDGRHLLHGIDPYKAAPSEAEQVPSELLPIRPLINHPEYVTIYPPAAQLVFAAGAATGKGVTGLKALMVLLDLALCGMIILVLTRLHLPVQYSILYAWNPLPVLEIAGSGHLDGAGMLFFLAACAFLVMERSRQSSPTPRKAPCLLAGAFMAAAVLVKLFPLVLFPALFLLTPAGGRRYFFAAFLVMTAALLLPFEPNLGNLAETLDVYARNWEFSGFAFGFLRKLTDSGDTARLILGGAFILYISLRYACLARALKREGLLGAGETDGIGRLVLRACYDISLAFLLLTPTLQPWYALYLAVFLPFAAGPAGVVLCWVVLLSYRVQLFYVILGQWIESDTVTALIFFAPIAAWCLGKLFRPGNRFYTAVSGGPA